MNYEIFLAIGMFTAIVLALVLKVSTSFVAKR